MRELAKYSLSGALAAIITIGFSVPTSADKETSVALYNAAKRKYDLGEYKKAIALFEQAYDEHPFPAYLYNIAMSHLKLEACTEALEFFGKYLTEKPDAPNRAEVDGRVAELEAKCPKTATDDTSDTGDTNTGDTTGTTTDTTNATDNSSGQTKVANATGTETKADTTNTSTEISTGATPKRRRFFTASADLGLALYDIGDVVVPVTPALRVAGALPLEYFGVAFEPYGAIELQTMAYDHADGMETVDSTVLFSTLLVGASATYPAGKVRVGGDIGFGIFHFSGLKMGNPFIAAGAEQSGSVNTFAFRFGAQAEYDLGGGLSAAFSPAYVIATGDDDLRDEISSISRIEFMVGARYRL